MSEWRHWNKVELEQKFVVMGAFYQVEVEKKKFLFRKEARVIRRSHAHQALPDAVVVMVNPGSCSPYDTLYQPPTVSHPSEEIPFVVAKSDQTQLQLMRLMMRMNWNYVSIINISDICSGNLDDFFAKRNLLERSAYNVHSIFTTSRQSEMTMYLGQPDCKLIIAWGKNLIIRELASSALRFFPINQKYYGLRDKNNKWAYSHPFPHIETKCIKWLDDMEAQLDDKLVKDAMQRS